MDRVLFFLTLISLAIGIVINGVNGNWAALGASVSVLLFFIGWHSEARQRKLANESLEYITAQLLAVNKDTSRG